MRWRLSSFATRSQSYECTALVNLGHVAWRSGSHAEAENLLQETLRLVRLTNNQLMIGHALTFLGHLWLDEGKVDAARRCYGESAELFTELRTFANKMNRAEFLCCDNSLLAWLGNRTSPHSAPDFGLFLINERGKSNAERVKLPEKCR